MDYNLRQHCHVNTNIDKDCFVGLKVNSDSALIYFPAGYQLSNTQKELRGDINNLIQILYTFQKKYDSYNHDLQKLITVNFPVQAYLTIIKDFLKQERYFNESETVFKKKDMGKIDWKRTIKSIFPLINKSNNIVYNEFITRESINSNKEDITNIHKYCVYEAFNKLGWIYSEYLPPKPAHTIPASKAIRILNKYLQKTNNDYKKNILVAMKNIILYKNNQDHTPNLSLGTEYFEYIWQEMIDEAFGIKNKNEYYPYTKWNLTYSFNEKINQPLQPDSIMIFDNTIFILDAKYYKYGITGLSKHLPTSVDINKQITYGEYIDISKNYPSNKIYNCFIIPYNKQNNIFNSEDEFLNIGEATASWKNSKNKPYEHIQGILLDTKYLMENYNKTHNTILKEKLYNCILGNKD